MAKLKVVRGWTLLRRHVDWMQWHQEHQSPYGATAPCYPCLVQERITQKRITADEGSTYEYLTLRMLDDIQQALKDDIQQALGGLP